jgi:uncharacterized protein
VRYTAAAVTQWTWKSRLFASAGRALGALALAAATLGAPARAGSLYLDGVGFGGGAASLTVESFQEQKYQNTIAQEHDFSCGSAALATLLTYNYKVPVTEDQVFKSMFENGDKETISKSGFSLLDMKKYLDRRGIDSAGFRAPLAKLQEVRLPAIVLINVRGYRHFVVLEGIRNGRVLLSDPANGSRTEQLGVFQAQWTGVFFLILNDVDQAQATFNSGQRWATAPGAPMALARYTVDLATLAQPALRDISKF